MDLCIDADQRWEILITAQDLDGLSVVEYGEVVTDRDVVTVQLKGLPVSKTRGCSIC